MSLASAFIGVPQSRYAAVAVLAAILVVGTTMLLGKDAMPFGQKLAFVLLMLLVSVPGILLTLFQMTCMVTGAGLNNQRWWCSLYSWVISILLILYCSMLIVVAVIALVTGEKVIQQVNSAEAFTDLMDEADQAATAFFVGDQPIDKEKEVDTDVVDTFTVKGSKSLPEPVQTKPPTGKSAEAFSDFAAY